MIPSKTAIDFWYGAEHVEITNGFARIFGEMDFRKIRP